MGGVINFFEDVITAPIDFVGDIIEDVPIIGDVWEFGSDIIHTGFDLLSGDIYDVPEIAGSPTYKSEVIYNTIGEGIPVALCYGTCKIGGNKIRFNDEDDADLRIIVGHCRGPVSGVATLYVNDIAWADLTGTHTKTEYTGTRTQTADARFSVKASAYRGIAYHAFTFVKDDHQIGSNPTITCVMNGRLCAPLAGGADAFTRNPAVILYDFYRNIEGRAADELNLNAFKSLEALCNAVPTGGTLPRYRFDYNIDTDTTINDAKKLIWRSFNGQVIMSQGKLKPVWDSGQMADGAGGLTAKTVSHVFTMDNIVKDSFTWSQPEKYNVVRISYIDSANSYQKTTVEVKDDLDIEENGEIPYEETCYFIVDSEIARRRAQFKFNKIKHENYLCSLTAFSGAGDLEIYDLVTVTHTLPGWTEKEFIVESKSEDMHGRPSFTLRAYYSGVYDDSSASVQSNYQSTLPNPYRIPLSSTDVSAAMTAVGTSYDFDAVRVSFTPPANDPFYSYSEIYASKDDSTYYYIGRDGTGSFTFNALGVVYEPGDTCYIKIRSVSTMGVKEDLPAAASTSVLVSSTMRLGGFYAGLNDFWGGNAAIGNAATKIVIGNLDGVPKIALGPSADAITFAGTQTGFFADGAGNLRAGGAQSLKWNPLTSRLTIGEWIVSPSGIADNFTEASANILLDKINTLMRLGPTSGKHITADGANLRLRSSNYVSGALGAGFTLEPDLLEVGNIAARGIIRTSVFEYDSVSVHSGSDVTVKGGDVLAADMTAADESIINRITEAGDIRITEAGDIRILSGIAELTIGSHDTFEAGDILRIKEGTDDEWLEVSTIVNAPAYGVARDLAGSYTANNNPVWTKGASVSNYGQAGDGGIYITASDTNAPNLSVFTHAGSPWNDITTHLRLGNLNGYAGYEADMYGMAAYIDANNYIKIDPTNGIRMSGEIVITGGSMPGLTLDDLADGSTYGRVQIGALDGGYVDLLRKSADSTERLLVTASGIEGYANDVKNFELASGIAYLGDQSNEHIKLSSAGLEIKDGAAVLATYGSSVTIGEVGASKSNVHITSGAVQLRNNTTPKLTLAADGSIALASGITMGTAGYLRTTGKDNYADTTAGIFLGYDTDDYKLNIGDASEYIKWDGSKLIFGVTFAAMQVFTSSGTYTTPSNVSALRVRIIGGGGGGSGGGGDGVGAGSDGGDTSFGSAVAGGGKGGPTTFVGGAGGTASGSGWSTGLSLSGSHGQPGLDNASAGAGGGSPLGGPGEGGRTAGTAGGAAAANTGSGGGGGGDGSSAGGGGGSGAYMELWYTSLSSSYSVTIGTGGAGGSAGQNGAAGGAGGSGVVIVEAFR